MYLVIALVIIIIWFYYHPQQLNFIMGKKVKTAPAEVSTPASEEEFTNDISAHMNYNSDPLGHILSGK